MSSIVKELQRNLIQSQKSTIEHLRTAKLIAVKLGLNDISEWVSCELTGYPPTAKIPPFRCFNGGDLQVFTQQKWTRIGSVAKVFPIKMPLTEIEALMNEGEICIILPADERYAVQNNVRISQWEQRVVLTKTGLKRLLEAVKDRLLDWALELEHRGILGEDMSFSDMERKSAHNQTFHIQNFTGVLGNVTHSNVQIYDYSSLHQTLKQQNVPQEERNELENILDSLKTAKADEESGLVELGKAWVVKNEKFLGATASIVKAALGIE